MKGELLIIGGHEDREGEMRLLRHVAEACGDGLLVVATLASAEPDELWADYERAFGRLGVRRVAHLDVRTVEEAHDPRHVRLVDEARVLFFTGGDQLRITSKLGASSLVDALRCLRARGGLVAGTSAGASAMSETMLVAGPGDESVRVRDSLRMAPGLGLVPGIIFDQHFAQRGRIGRLLGAVARNPRVLGIGIDEDTALRVGGTEAHVLGSGAVYVLDGRGLTHTNVADGDDETVLSVFDVHLHVLSEGDRFDLDARRPHAPALARR